MQGETKMDKASPSAEVTPWQPKLPPRFLRSRMLTIRLRVAFTTLTSSSFDKIRKTTDSISTFKNPLLAWHEFSQRFLKYGSRPPHQVMRIDCPFPNVTSLTLSRVVGPEHQFEATLSAPASRVLNLWVWARRDCVVAVPDLPSETGSVAQNCWVVAQPVYCFIACRPWTNM